MARVAAAAPDDGPEGPFQIDLGALRRLPPAERREAESRLAELRELLERNPLWGYRPHAKQAVFHGIRSFYGAFIGGNRSGKTFGGCADDVIQAVDRSCLPPWLERFKVFEEFYGRVIVPGQAESLDVVLPLFRRLIPKDQLYKGEWERAYDQRRRKLQFANGNWVDFMSHDQNVDRFAGVTLHRVRFDEEPPGSKGQQIFNESKMRTTEIDGGQVRFTMTPLFGLSWSYHLLTRDGDPRWDDECKVVSVSMGDNPHLPRAQIERVLAGLSEREREAREHGRFVHLAGLVFPQFSRERHLVPDGEIPRWSDGEPLWEFFDGIDPGYDHPAGYCLVGIDSDGVATVVASWKMRGATVEEVSKRIMDTRRALGVTPRYTVIDPSARNKNHATGRSVQMEYLEQGIPTVAGQNSRAAGINRIATALEHDKLILWASNDALRDEFETHRWKASQGEERSREEVIKVNDDILDPLRYVLMSRPRPADERVPEEVLPEEVVRFREHLAGLGRQRSRGAHPLGPGAFR